MMMPVVASSFVSQLPYAWDQQQRQLMQLQTDINTVKNDRALWQWLSAPDEEPASSFVEEEEEEENDVDSWMADDIPCDGPEAVPCDNGFKCRLSMCMPDPPIPSSLVSFFPLSEGELCDSSISRTCATGLTCRRSRCTR